MQKTRPASRRPATSATMLLAFTVAACTPSAPLPPPPPSPAEEPKLVKRTIPASGRHEVVDGETLSEIAYIYSLSPRTLAHANGVHNPDVIYVGQSLRLTWPRRPAATTSEPPTIAAPPVLRADANDADSPLRVVVAPRDEGAGAAADSTEGDDGPLAEVGPAAANPEPNAPNTPTGVNAKGFIVLP